MIESQILFILSIINTAILAAFFISTTFTYIHQKQKIALYLSLLYAAYLVFMILLLIRNFITLSNGGNDTLFTLQLGYFGQSFIVLGLIMSLFFYNEFSELNKKLQLFGVIFGIIIMLYLMVIPFVINMSEKNFLITLGYMLMFFYGVIIYAFISKQFYSIYKKTVKRKKETLILFIGMVLWLFYFFWSVLHSFLLNIYSHVFMQVLLLIILSCYFLGLYYPKLKRGK